MASDLPRGYVSALAAIAIAATPKGIATPEMRPASPAASTKGTIAPVAARPQASQNDQSTRDSRCGVESIERNHVASARLTCDHLVTYSRRGVDQVFKALADESRRSLLDNLFSRDGQTLGELGSGLEMTRFGAMKHLRVLERAGLVITRKVGRRKLHYLNPVPIQEIHQRWVSKYAAPWLTAIGAIKSELEGEARRPPSPAPTTPRDGRATSGHAPTKRRITK